MKRLLLIVAALITASRGPDWKSSEELLDVVMANAAVQFLYARELKRRLPKPKKPAQLEIPCTTSSPTSEPAAAPHSLTRPYAQMSAGTLQHTLERHARRLARGSATGIAASCGCAIPRLGT